MYSIYLPIVLNSVQLLPYVQFVLVGAQGSSYFFFFFIADIISHHLQVL